MQMEAWSQTVQQGCTADSGPQRAAKQLPFKLAKDLRQLSSHPQA